MKRKNTEKPNGNQKLQTGSNSASSVNTGSGKPDNTESETEKPKEGRQFPQPMSPEAFDRLEHEEQRYLSDLMFGRNKIGGNFPSSHRGFVERFEEKVKKLHDPVRHFPMLIEKEIAEIRELIKTTKQGTFRPGESQEMDYLRQIDYYNRDIEFLEQQRQHIKSKKGSKLSLSQVALIYIYRGISITRANGDEIARKHGYTSGEKLFQLYTKYFSRSNRIGLEETSKKNQNKIKLLEFVLRHLVHWPDAQRVVKDELNILKSVYEKGGFII